MEERRDLPPCLFLEHFFSRLLPFIHFLWLTVLLPHLVATVPELYQLLAQVLAHAALGKMLEISTWDRLCWHQQAGKAPKVLVT